MTWLLPELAFQNAASTGGGGGWGGGIFRETVYKSRLETIVPVFSENANTTVLKVSECHT